MSKTKPTDRLRSTVSRRQFTIGLGALAASGSLLVLGTGESRAAVSIQDFAAENASLESGADPHLKADLAYEYDLGAQATVEEVAFELRVAEDTIASERLSTSESALSSTVSLDGPLVSSGSYSSSDFAVSEKTSFDLDVSVWFGVLNASGDTIAEATASDTATVVIKAGKVIAVGGVVTLYDDGTTTA